MELMEDVSRLVCVCRHVCVCDLKLLSSDKLITTLLNPPLTYFLIISFILPELCVCTFVKQKNSIFNDAISADFVCVKQFGSKTSY